MFYLIFYTYIYIHILAGSCRFQRHPIQDTPQPPSNRQTQTTSKKNSKQDDKQDSNQAELASNSISQQAELTGNSIRQQSELTEKK